ncbi:MAG: M15 family metallopeptidase [Clostridiales bacterium]|nr:M15 family metallopeptidase [Clostridiales bacterium]
MKRSFVVVLICLLVIVAVGCGKKVDAEGIDYLVLVNKENKLPDTWEREITIVKYVDSQGWDVETEKEAFEAYQKLHDALEKEDVHVDLDSAYRSVAEQERIVKDFTEKYGEDYVKQYVAVPGFSEHHTGLALDLYLNIDGADVYENEDMVQYPEVWAKIHEKLAEYGFILRYLEGREAITGYSYEPWHIRYVGDPAIAKDIMEKGITLEEYLGKLPTTDVAP